MGALDQIAAGRAPLYDFSLMMDSGSLKGWFLQEENIFDAVADILAQLKAQSRAGMLYAMGDGNHSFAAAKEHWDTRKAGLTAAQRESHPARFGLVELVNLYDPALVFEPIHRLLIGVDPHAVQRDLGFDAKKPAAIAEAAATVGWMAGPAPAGTAGIYPRGGRLPSPGPGAGSAGNRLE